MTQSEQARPQNEPEPASATNDEGQDPKPQSRAEWISLSVSATLLAIVIGFVIYLWASDRQRQPPILEVSQTTVRYSEGEFYVPFEITNVGGTTAESVQIVAELQVGGITVESGEQILDFLSSQEKASGAFVFTRDPQQGELIIRVASYQDP